MRAYKDSTQIETLKTRLESGRPRKPALPVPRCLFSASVIGVRLCFPGGFASRKVWPMQAGGQPCPQKGCNGERNDGGGRGMG